VNIAPIRLGGGLDLASPSTALDPGLLVVGTNIECKRRGGYRRILGYEKFDADEVPGEGDILGVWHYDNKVYAARNETGGATAAVYESSGSGWTAIKTGLAPDGNYEFVNYAFAGTEKMYGVSGTHKAFEWDGSTWTDITSGVLVDTPTHIIAHRKHLFLSFQKSIQNSGIGDPHSWTLASGANERVMNNFVSGFAKLPNGALGIFSETEITLLSGTSAADWTAEEMSEYGNNAGAVAGSIQMMGSTVRYMDSRGVSDLAASQKSSDFEDAIISTAVDDLLSGKWRQVTASTVVRAKNQYRLFFADGTGLLFVFNPDGVPMITQMRFPHVVKCACNTEDNNGDERIYFGSDDGYVRRMETGNNFDGEKILAIAETAYTNMKTPSQIKRFRRLRADLQADGIVNLEARGNFYFGIGGLPRNKSDALSLEDSSAVLGSATLGSSRLGGTPLNEGVIELNGRGDWANFRFLSNSDNEPVWELDGITIEYLPGKQRR
jgi:hypothetical protein